MARVTYDKQGRTLFRGKPLVDADESLVIRVQRRDINRANPRDPWTCAIAQAAMRDERITEVKIGKTTYIGYPNRWVRYVLAGEDQRKIDCFDRSGYFPPTTIHLRPAPPSRRLGSKKLQGTSTRKTRQRRPSVLRRPSLRHI